MNKRLIINIDTSKTSKNTSSHPEKNPTYLKHFHTGPVTIDHASVNVNFHKIKYYLLYANYIHVIYLNILL